MSSNHNILIGSHLRLFAIAVMAIVAIPSFAAPVIRDAGSPQTEERNAKDPTNIKHSGKKQHLEAELVIPASWASLTHNPIVLAIRFHGIRGSLRKQTVIGKLAVNDLGKYATIKIAGTQKIDGETLPYISISYPVKGMGSANAELEDVRGKVIMFSLKCALRTPQQMNDKLVSEYLEPGKLALLTSGVSGIETTSFGDGVPFQVEHAQISNSALLKVKRSTPTLPLVAMGALNIAGNNLTFDHFKFSFTGEGNVLDLSGDMRIPEKMAWDYQMPDNRFIWKSGQLDVSNLDFRSEPHHLISFGGIAIGLDELKIDSTMVTKDDSSPNALPSAALTGILVRALELNYKKSTLTGSLKEPISIKQLSGQVNVTNIFEGVQLAEQQVKNMHIGLADIAYKNDNGLSVGGRSLDISVANYTSHSNEDGSLPSTNVDASIDLQDAPISQQDNGNFTVNRFVASLGGPVDKLSGHGQIDGTLSNASTQFGIDMSKLFGHCAPDNKMRLDISQQGSAWLQGDINILNGDPSGTITIPHLELAFRPQYWRCDYDDGTIGFNLPGIHVGWDGIWLTSDGPYVQIGTVHWKAEFIPLGGGVGELAMAEVRFDKQGAKLCGGHTVAAFGLWTPAFGPDFPDCGSWWCNIPRDIVSGVYGLAEAPAGLFLNLAALGVVNTVGLFDAGIFQNKCQ